MQLRTCGDGDGRVELFFHNTNTYATQTWYFNANGTLKTSRNIVSGNIATKWDIEAVAPDGPIF